MPWQRPKSIETRNWFLPLIDVLVSIQTDKFHTSQGCSARLILENYVPKKETDCPVRELITLEINLPTKKYIETINFVLSSRYCSMESGLRDYDPTKQRAISPPIIAKGLTLISPSGEVQV